MTNIQLSVIIPTYNRISTLTKCLDALVKQKTQKKFEVIVIDDGYGKGTKEVCRKYKFCKYIYQKNLGPAMARNLGIKKSVGKILIFINDDCLVEGDFISRHNKFHEKYFDNNIALVGLFLTDESITKTNAMRWLEDSGMHFNENIKKSVELVDWYRFWTGNCSLKRDFIIKNNIWFDKDFKTAAWEDIEFAYRANKIGMKIYRDKRIVGRHYHRFDYKNIFNRFFSHGRGLFQMSKKVPNCYLPPLAKRKYRIVARFLLGLCLSNMTGKWLTIMIENHRLPGNDMLMRYLMVYWKIKGFDYEANLNISRH